MPHDYTRDEASILALGLAAIAARRARAQLPACEDLTSPKAELLRCVNNVGNVVTRFFGLNPSLSHLDMRFEQYQQALREALAALDLAHRKCEPDSRTGAGPVSDRSWVAVHTFLTQRRTFLTDIRALHAAHTALMANLANDPTVVDPHPEVRLSRPAPEPRDKWVVARSNSRGNAIRRRVNELDAKLDTARTEPGAGKRRREAAGKPRSTRASRSARQPVTQFTTQHVPVRVEPGRAMRCRCGRQFDMRNEVGADLALKHFATFRREYGG